MNEFNVVYYPNCECSPLTLAKSILIFNQVTFFDHVSITMGSIGTVGHESRMRAYQPLLKKEGYQINIINPEGGRVENELQRIIDADLLNESYRAAFLKLIRVDPTFLVQRVPNGNWGLYGSAENLRRLILNVKNEEIPRSVDEISEYKPTRDRGIDPAVMIAMDMARDSYNLNLSSYLAVEHGLQFFSDSPGMASLLDAKLNDPRIAIGDKSQGLAHQLAFTLLEKLIPNEAFKGKTLVDVVRFRNKTEKEREKFQERILQLATTFESYTFGQDKRRVQQLIDSELLPEAREYQYKLAENWDKFFKESTKSVLGDASQIGQFIGVTIFTQSVEAAMLAGAARVGMKIFPHLIDFLKEKEALQRRNPFAYLMKF